MSDYIGRELRRPVANVRFTAADMLDPETRFNPNGPEKWDRHGNRIDVEFTHEVVERRDKDT